MPLAVDFQGGVSSAWSNVITFVPKLAAALLIILVGYLLARVVASVLNKVLERVGFDRAVAHSLLILLWRFGFWSKHPKFPCWSNSVSGGPNTGPVFTAPSSFCPSASKKSANEGTQRCDSSGGSEAVAVAAKAIHRAAAALHARDKRHGRRHRRDADRGARRSGPDDGRIGRDWINQGFGINRINSIELLTP